jgi:hypothetical protein
MWFDPELRNRRFPFNVLGLGYDSIEVTLPISPQQLLLFSWRTAPGYLPWPLGIDDINWQTRANCDERFIVCRNVVRSSWLQDQPPSSPSKVA